MNIPPRLITNIDDQKNHLATLDQMFKDAGRIFISVAFLKKSGFDLLWPLLKRELDAGAEMELFVGIQKLYVTEPKALRALHAALKQYDNAQLYLCAGAEITYHPKLYCAFTEAGVLAVVGSANVSKSALKRSVEASTLNAAAPGEPFMNDVEEYRIRLLASPDTQKATSKRIARYEKGYKAFAPYRKAKEAADQQGRSVAAIAERYKLDAALFEEAKADYARDKEAQDSRRRRAKNYRMARQVLDEMHAAKLASAKDFLHYYNQLVPSPGHAGLWYAGNLQRSKKKLADQFGKFQDMLNTVYSHLDDTPGGMFAAIWPYIDPASSKTIKQFSVVVLTQILNTLAPKKFAVLNAPPLTALDLFGIGGEAFPQQRKFDADTYGRYCRLIEQIRTACGFKDLGEVDNFLRWVAEIW